MDAERWQRLSPLLDALFELDEDARARSLALMRDEDPDTAEALAELLRLEDEREDFLSEPLVAPLPGPRPGVQVGPYRLDRLLGEGGMGQVWLAHRADGLYQRRVALKLLRPGLVDPNLRLRFTRERQILARLAHPHIARLLDAGISSDHQPYLALEYIEGVPITDYCRQRKLSLDARLRLFRQVCEAVSHAHANLIVHRDLKPSNILVTPAGDVRLLDFGIAKLIDAEVGTPESTGTGVRAFTLHYAAPEQVRGEPVSTMTDVYALGVVLYELLADAKPYRLKRQTDAEWEEAILVHDPVRPSQALQQAADAGGAEAVQQRRRARIVAGDLDNIVLKALAKLPQQRYASVEAMAQDLERYELGKPVLARPQSVRYRMHKYVIRHRWALATGVSVAGVLAAALAIVAWQAREALEEAARAQALQDFVIGLFEAADNVPRDSAIDVRALLDTSILRANQELARQPLARAEVLGIVARLRLRLGDYRQARAVLARQQDILATLGNAPTSLQLEAASLRGQAERELDAPRACIATMQPWLERADREQSQLPTQAAEFYSELARCRGATGATNGARQLLEHAITLRRDVLQDEVGVIENRIDLANVAAEAGDDTRALAALREALAQLRQRVGDRHPLAIRIQRRMAVLLRDQGQADDAARAYDAALALSTELLGLRHPTTLALRRERADVYLEQGWLDVAERDLRELVPLLAERLGGGDAETGSSRHALGMVAWERGDLAQAERELQQAVAIWRRAAPGLPLASGLLDLGQVLGALGQQRQATASLAEARELRVARYGPRHPAVAEVDLAWGRLLAAEGRHAAATARLRQAEAVLRTADKAPSARGGEALLALAREEALAGDDAALARIRQVASWPRTSSALRRLHWRARAYLADAQCRAGETTGARALGALEDELHAALPQGGRLPREVAALRAGCLPLATR